MIRNLAVLATALALTPMGAAEASRPGVTPHSACVSGYEFNQIRTGADRGEVEALLDGPGREGVRPNVAVYRSCTGSWSRAQVVVRYAYGHVELAMGLRVDAGSLEVPARR